MSLQSILSTTDFIVKYKLTFINDLPERLVCILCKDILKNAKQTSCGCKVCEKCIKDYLQNREKPCPSKECGDTRLKYERDVLQDNATNKEIGLLMITCVYKACDKTDMIKNIVSHIVICEYREMSCEKCSKIYPFKDKVDHDENECDQRIVLCPHCHIKMVAITLQTIHLNLDHEEFCSNYIGHCPNECGAQSLNIKQHLSKCTQLRLECPFNFFQCSTKKLTKTKLNEHLHEEKIQHFTKFVSEFTKLKKENQTLSEETLRIKTLLTEQMNITQRLTESRLKIEGSVEDLKKKSSGISLSNERNIIFRNGSLIWKISDFERLKSDAERGERTSTTSDPFYTSEFGYKMCLRIYPAGDGVGRGSHLSVFFAIMKGDLDDLLVWPFKQKVTLSLLDQENNGAKNHSDTFKPDANSPCYFKPIEDCNIASGSPKFFPLSNLFPKSIYYKNDRIFLKISVDTIGLPRP